jgi:hypothetical protein
VAPSSRRRACRTWGVAPGLEVPVELRWAPKAAAATVGYNPVNLAAGDLENLHQWIEHLDALQIDHSPIVPANAGHLVVFRSPDGIYLRLLNPIRLL